MENQLYHTWFLNHPPQVVWQYLTDADLLAKWLMPNNFKLKIGHQFVFGTTPKWRFGFDGRIFCELLDFELHQMIKYSWKGGNGDQVKLDSVVTWTLAPEGPGTKLTLAHTGFKGLRNYLPYLVMGKGWLKIVERLSKVMEQQ